MNPDVNKSGIPMELMDEADSQKPIYKPRVVPPTIENAIIGTVSTAVSIINLDPEKLLLDAYYGSGGFFDGSYLVPHKRETLAKYETRREVSYFLNYTFPVVNSHVDPIFRKEAERDCGNNAMYAKFMADVDTNNTDLATFMKQAAIMACLLGVCFIAEDSFPDQPKSVADVMTQRKFPYLSLLEPSLVKKYSVDRFGRLTSITYKILESVEDDTTKFQHITWTQESWQIARSDGTLEPPVPHNLKRVPVVALFSRKVKPGVYKPQSEFYQVARANLRIFNLCSELDEILRSQAFSILTYPGGASNKTNNITVGVENVLGYSAESSNKPEFIAPSPDPANMIMQQIDRIVQEIYRMSGISHVTGVEKAQSGVSKQYDFQKQNDSLSDFARNCENVEHDIADIFMRWTGTTFTYTCDYGEDFGITDITEDLEKALTALSVGIGGEFDKEVKMQVARSYFANLDETRLNEILTDIQSLFDDEQEALKDQAEFEAKQNEQILAAGASGDNTNTNTNTAK